MFIAYLGEKSKFSDFIIPYVPKNFSTYVEPFGGAYGIFFSLNLNKYKNSQFIYNDINHLNYNLFNQLKYNDNFINILKEINPDEDMFNKALLDLENPNKLKSAINWMIVLNCSSPHNIKKWKNKNYFDMFKIKWNFYKPMFNKISKIHNLDYKEVMNMYDSKDTFFYLDPPYKGKEDYYINHNFTEKSHYELADYLKTIKGKFILSYYYFDDLFKLYKNYDIHEKKTIMGTEYIIVNF